MLPKGWMFSKEEWKENPKMPQGWKYKMLPEEWMFSREEWKESPSLPGGWMASVL